MVEAIVSADNLSGFTGVSIGLGVQALFLSSSLFAMAVVVFEKDEFLATNPTGRAVATDKQKAARKSPIVLFFVMY